MQSGKRRMSELEAQEAEMCVSRVPGWLALAGVLLQSRGTEDGRGVPAPQLACLKCIIPPCSKSIGRGNSRIESSRAVASASSLGLAGGTAHGGWMVVIDPEGHRVTMHWLYAAAPSKQLDSSWKARRPFPFRQLKPVDAAAQHWSRHSAVQEMTTYLPACGRSRWSLQGRKDHDHYHPQSACATAHDRRSGWIQGR